MSGIAGAGIGAAAPSIVKGLHDKGLSAKNIATGQIGLLGGLVGASSGFQLAGKFGVKRKKLMALLGALALGGGSSLAYHAAPGV